MTNKSIIDMYKRGISVQKIIKDFYRYKNKDIPENHYFNGNYIVTPKKYSYEYCSNYIYRLLLQYNDIRNENAV